MAIDLISLFLLFLFVLGGYFSGAWLQLARIAAFSGAYFLSSPIGSALAPSFAKWLNVQPFTGKIIAWMAAWFLLYFILSIIGLIIVQTLRRRGKSVLNKTDRILGPIIGGLKGIIIIYVALAILALFSSTIRKHSPMIGKQQDQSKIMSIIGDHNLLANISPFRDIKILTDVLNKYQRSPKRFLEAIKDPALRKSPFFKRLYQELKKDPKLRVALEQGDIIGLLKSKRLLNLLTDEKRLEELKQINKEIIY